MGDLESWFLSELEISRMGEEVDHTVIGRNCHAVGCWWRLQVVTRDKPEKPGLDLEPHLKLRHGGGYQYVEKGVLVVLAVLVVLVVLLENHDPSQDAHRSSG